MIYETIKEDEKIYENMFMISDVIQFLENEGLRFQSNRY